MLGGAEFRPSLFSGVRAPKAVGIALMKKVTEEGDQRESK
jgi:hypothetical protein